LTQSTLAVFQLLHKIAEDGKKMLKVFVSLISVLLSIAIVYIFAQFLSYLPVISRQQLNLGMSKDNIEIALILQSLVQDKSYKDIIPAVPEEVALSVINLTHRVCFCELVRFGF
jgi:hypothetical protein